MNIQPVEPPHIRKIIELAKNNSEIEILWLYGSQARGGANSNSDYDLAVTSVFPLKEGIPK